MTACSGRRALSRASSKPKRRKSTLPRGADAEWQSPTGLSGGSRIVGAKARVGANESAAYMGGTETRRQEPVVHRQRPIRRASFSRPAPTLMMAYVLTDHRHMVTIWQRVRQ
jgi:hypothetical protein